jgi:DNA gyrase/topoisomerase IV subunit A
VTELQNQKGRREMVNAFIYAAENAARVVEICSTTAASDEDLPRVLADACGLTMFQAEVILTMQVKRFSPHALLQLRAELVDIDEEIDRLSAE